MADYEKVLQQFIEEKKYLENPQVEGIVFFGSYLTGYNSSNSDLDLTIIMKNDDSNYIKFGIKEINEMKIDYYERPLNELYSSALSDFKNQNNMLLSMIGHGKILFDRNGNVQKLRDYIINLYSIPLPGILDDEAKAIIASLNNRISYLTLLCKEDNPYFEHVYQATSGNIRDFYHRLYAFAELPSYKIHRFYHDNDGYKDTIFKNIPDDRFIELFDKAITSKENNEKKMQYLEDLYAYATRDICLDPLNYQIRIKSKTTLI